MQIRQHRFASGLTIIELLIVMAVIALLAITVIVMLQPMEQLKKTRDRRRLADARELIISYDRYMVAYQRFPWDEPGVIDMTKPSSLVAVTPDFSDSPNPQDHYYLLERNEIKGSFITRKTIVDDDLLVSVSAQGLASICFEPESFNARTGGMAPIKTQLNASLPPHDCDDPYGVSTNCYVCLPF
jgi:hypothetical protein